MFSALRAVLLRPLPTPDLERLIVVQDDSRLIGLRKTRVSPAEAVDIAARDDLFDASASFTTVVHNWTGDGEPQRVTAAATLGEFFRVFSLLPRLGRFYRPDDSRNGGERQAVLSYDFWQEVSGGDERVVGRALMLDGVRFEVIGVLPADFRFPRSAQLFVPFKYEDRLDEPRERGTLIMTAVSRLRAGVSLERARTELQREAQRWHVKYAREFKYESIGHTLVATPLVAVLAGALQPVTLALMGAVSVVLLIACANVVSLQLVRATIRSKEFAIRSALGATPRQLARALLVESLILAVGGGLLGMAFAKIIIVFLARWAPQQAVALSDVRLDGPVLAFGVVVAALAAAIFGSAPALRAARTDPLDAIKEGAHGASGGPGRHRMLRAIVAGQLALTTLLVLATGLLVRSLVSVLGTSPGFLPDHVLTASVVLPTERYPSNTAVAGFYAVLLEKLANLPGVGAAGLTDALPLSEGGDSSPFRLTDRPLPAGTPPGHANMHTVSDGYFRTLGIPLLRGRTFASSDDDLAPRVVVIDNQLAQHFFPGEDPIGRQIDQGRVATIIGVVGTVNQSALGEAPKATTYYSYRQRNWVRAMSMAVRAGGDPVLMNRTLRRAVAEVDPALAVYDVRSMPERVAESTGTRRFTTGILGGFAGLALMLGVLGMYGVMSYTTAQRGRELSIRKALGADSRHLLWIVLGDGARMAGAGVAAGVVAFFLIGGAASALLYGVGPRDPLTVGGAVALLGVAGLLASAVPAFRAARLEPSDALRTG